MGRRRNKFIEVMGAIYTLTPDQFKKFMLEIAKGNDPDINQYGKLIATNAVNVTDMTPEQAQEYLGITHEFEKEE